jgi:hypothetical protein
MHACAKRSECNGGARACASVRRARQPGGKWWRGGYDEPGQSTVGRFEEAFARYQDAK